MCLAVATLQSVVEIGIPFALKYSARAISSMVSRASASSLANACSSSYSPGRPNRSNRILPEPAQPETQNKKMMRDMRMMEPKDETRPMMTPVKADDDDGIAMMTMMGAAVLAKSRRRDGG